MLKFFAKFFSILGNIFGVMALLIGLVAIYIEPTSFKSYILFMTGVFFAIGAFKDNFYLMFSGFLCLILLKINN